MENNKRTVETDLLKINLDYTKFTYKDCTVIISKKETKHYVAVGYKIYDNFTQKQIFNEKKYTAKNKSQPYAVLAQKAKQIIDNYLIENCYDEF